MNIENQRRIASLITSGKAKEAIEELNKIDVNTPLDGRSALGIAASYDNFEVARFVIDKGADPNGLNTEQFTPLMIAAERGDLELLKLLIAHKANLHIKTTQNVVALWKAVAENHIEASKLLVEAGADPFAEIANGMSIYNVCKQMNKTEMVDYFESIKGNY